MLSKQPWLLIPFVAGASSIGSLLLYFAGVLPFGTAVSAVLLPGIALGAGFVVWARWSGRPELADRVLAGVWAGGLATLAYDLVRVPLVHAGLPVFKAISYFGTVALGQVHPTLASELAGWSYHLSNGIGFAVMYACLVRRPRWFTAAAWAVTLEACMLLTPYVEVFDYTRGSRFFAVTLGSHLVYGTVLWAALRLWHGWATEPTALGGLHGRRLSGAKVAIGAAVALLGIGATAGDFHESAAASIPASPPAYIGPHLYTTWDTLEVDRVSGLWVLRRYVDPQARFYFVPPFSHVRYGTPFDLPDAKARRTGTRSSTENLLAEHGLDGNPVLARLARVTHHFEITPWLPSADPDVQGFGRDLDDAAHRCRPAEHPRCLAKLFARLDAWSARERSHPEVDLPRRPRKSKSN